MLVCVCVCVCVTQVTAAIVTCGGLCPGLNDVVAGIVNKLVVSSGLQVYTYATKRFPHGPCWHVDLYRQVHALWHAFHS